MGTGSCSVALSDSLPIPANGIPMLRLLCPFNNSHPMAFGGLQKQGDLK